MIKEELKKYRDDTNKALHERIKDLIQFLVRERTGFMPDINEMIPFHHSLSKGKLKTRTIAASDDFCYCIEAIFDYESEKLLAADFIFALRRGNRDFEVDIEIKGNAANIIPKVGPLKINEFKPIKTQKGDEFTAKEISEKLIMMVRNGRRILKNAITDEKLSTEEDIYVDLILKIRRFVGNFQRHIMNFVDEEGKSEKVRHLETFLKSTYKRKQKQIEFSLKELIEILDNPNFSSMITDVDELKYFAFQKEKIMLNLKTISKIQDKLVHSHMPVSEEIREQCFKSIRKINAKMMRFDDDFNNLLDDLS